MCYYIAVVLLVFLGPVVGEDNAAVRVHNTAGEDYEEQEAAVSHRSAGTAKEGHEAADAVQEAAWSHRLAGTAAEGHVVVQEVAWNYRSARAADEGLETAWNQRAVSGADKEQEAA